MHRKRTSIALVSFWPPTQFAHVANFAIGVWLIAFGFLASPYPTPPALQNDIVVGLLLLMLAIIPNHATRPPQPWHDFLVKSPKPCRCQNLNDVDLWRNNVRSFWEKWANAPFTDL